MNGPCYHPAPAIAYHDFGPGSLACTECGQQRPLTEHEQRKREAALHAFVRFYRQHAEETPAAPVAELLPLAHGVGYRGKVPDGREFGIGFEFDGCEPFPRPAPYWPPDVHVPLRSLGK